MPKIFMLALLYTVFIGLDYRGKFSDPTQTGMALDRPSRPQVYAGFSDALPRALDASRAIKAKT
jgi:hypothetical protein